MRYKVLSLVFLVVPGIVWAQFSDDFSSGDFTAWSGDREKFIVENQMLRLNDTQAGSAWLATQSQVVENTQWEFWTRLAFTPSNNNHPRIYLMSDSQDLTQPLNGYYLRIGKDGTDNKRLYFYRQTGETHTELLEGFNNIADATNNQLRIKVVRDQAGNWELWADPNGGEIFLPQGSVFDDVHISTQWFGLVCNYTVSNANAFFFDDFYVGEIIEDTTLPEITQIRAISQNTLEVTFNKALEPVSAQTITNFYVNRDIGPPSIAIRPEETPNKVILIFPGSFEEGISYVLSVNNLMDFNGNIMRPFTGSFHWYIPSKFDVVFNEIMANPTPPVGLPAHEYIELYNTTDFDIFLESWLLQHGNSMREIPDAVIPARGYIVFTHPAAYESLKNFGNVIAIPGLPATALTNAGTLLALYKPNHELVSWVNYSDQWYANPAKANGGWSLEKTDPYNFCEEAPNWRASNSDTGGTPGQTNSVRAENNDVTPPVLLRAGYEASNRISLFFSESMDDESLSHTANYTLSQGLGNPMEVVIHYPMAQKVELVLAEHMQPGQIYEVSLSNVLTDCAGNPLAENKARVAIPQPADSLDLVINEILFNPPDRGVRYMEVYNRSGKVIDLRNYILSSQDTLEGFLTAIRDISSESNLIFPGEYRVMTPEPETVKTQYMTPNPLGFIDMPLPSMTNTRGIVVVASKGHQIIDRFIYEEDMHYALLADKKGVALERVNYHRPTQSRSNWHSAAQSAGFGTPGFKNSQYSANPEGQQEVFEIYPAVFSPNNDGVDDLLHISYVADNPGYTANITIYDSRGRLIRTIARGRLLGTEDVVTWDGATDNNLKADVGIYIIHIELFNPQGEVTTFRKTAVLAARF